MTTTTEYKAHPFELAGMNHGPYSFVGMWSMPSTELAQQNPEAYNNAMREMPKLNGGCGTCSNCGMAIRNICIVKDGKGEVWGVGSDCVEKTEDKALCNPAKIALAKHQASLRRAAADKKREEDHAKWLVQPCRRRDAKPGETNGEYNSRQTSAQNERMEKLISKQKRAAEILAPLAGLLSDGRGGFSDSIANDMRNGIVPTGRAQAITLEILAKFTGRKGSKAYETEYDRLAEILEKASAA